MPSPTDLGVEHSEEGVKAEQREHKGRSHQHSRGQHEAHPRRRAYERGECQLQGAQAQKAHIRFISA